MRTREKLADVVAGQSGRQQRKQFVRSLKETAARAVVTASVTFVVGWALKRMFENSVTEAAKEGAAEAVQQEIPNKTPLMSSLPSYPMKAIEDLPSDFGR
ncbi:hypothetical protein U5A82_08735 [Sphingobium sp. CR2-8]|uniref:hypothetical protein n=1 Tax=Sphingobium sp. CR2-8 TaxID=1306534 RepID=UPI002DBCC302|nr:hypothetical protein [Sphingobium sp. CR2-8]MEC3910564.1 hypothetical protein [Sphingobium sp. CR2-8]